MNNSIRYVNPGSAPHGNSHCHFGCSLRVYACSMVHLSGPDPLSAARLLQPGRTAATAPLIISEFRLRGPNGPNDEFVEIYNNSDTPHTVTAFDGSGGYALVGSSNATLKRRSGVNQIRHSQWHGDSGSRTLPRR